MHTTNTTPDSAFARDAGRASHTSRPAAAVAVALAPIEEPIALEGVFADLPDNLKKALHLAGYVTPTPIQEQTIPHLLKGRDVLGCAQTGTGKTAAFALPLIQRLDAAGRRPSAGAPHALVLAPTRELAAQIAQCFSAYARFTRVRHAIVFGGVGYGPQIQALRRGVDILVATPGRLLDLMRQGHCTLRSVQCFILDEGDRMMDMGFLPDVKRIVEQLPVERQSLLFSATISDTIAELAKSIVRNPVRVAIAPEQRTVERIAQRVLFVDKQRKGDLLASVLGDAAGSKAIVFTQMKHMADRVTERLHAAGIKAVAIHGNKSQNARTRALLDFKQGSIQALVATDIAARGIDVVGISHVINYDLPKEAETYVHRIGRTARAGASGAAVSFCSAEERNQLRDIERFLRMSIPVDRDHAHHSEVACAAQGAAARPPAQGARGRGGFRGRPRFRR